MLHPELFTNSKLTTQITELSKSLSPTYSPYFSLLVLETEEIPSHVCAFFKNNLGLVVTVHNPFIFTRYL